MKIGIDFDRVLFDTDSFNDWLEENTGLHHVEGEVHDQHGCYSPKKHAELCGIDVEEVYSSIEDLSNFLYRDVDKLNELKPEHSLIFVTRGEERFQKTKIRESGINRLFDQLFIIQKGSKNVGDIDFLVDDREEELERAGLPGLVFDREKHSAEDIVEAVKEREA